MEGIDGNNIQISKDYLEEISQLNTKHEVESAIKILIDNISNIEFSKEKYDLLFIIAKKNFKVGRELLYLLIRKDMPILFFTDLSEENENNFYELLLFFYEKDLANDSMKYKFKGRTPRLLNMLIDEKNINAKKLISVMQKLFYHNYKSSTGSTFTDNLFENEQHQMRNLSLIVNLNNIFTYRDIFFNRKEEAERIEIFFRVTYNLYSILIRINDCSNYVRLKTVSVLLTLSENDLIPSFLMIGIFTIVLERIADRTQLVRKKVLEFLSFALSKLPENVFAEEQTNTVDMIFEKNIQENLEFDESVESFKSAGDFNETVLPFIREEDKKSPDSFKFRAFNFKMRLIDCFVDFGQHLFIADNSELEIGISILFRLLDEEKMDFQKICQVLNFTYENVKIDKNIQNLNLIFLKEIAIFFRKKNFDIEIIKNISLNLPTDSIISSYKTKNFIVRLDEWLPDFFNMTCGAESRCFDCSNSSNLKSLKILNFLNYNLNDQFLFFYHENILKMSCDVESLKTHTIVFKYIMRITEINFLEVEKVNKIFQAVAEMNYIDLKIIDCIICKIYEQSSEPEKLALHFLEYSYKSKDLIKIYHAVGLIAVKNSEFLSLNKQKSENINIAVPSKYRERRLSLKEESVIKQEDETESVNEDLIFYVREHETFYGNSAISISYNKSRNYLHGDDFSNALLHSIALLAMFRCMAVSSEVFVENKSILIQALEQENINGKYSLCDFLSLYNSFVEKHTVSLFTNMDLNLLLSIVAMAKTKIIKLHNFYADIFLACMRLTNNLKMLSDIILEEENIALTALYESLTKIPYDDNMILIKNIIAFIIPILKERSKIQSFIKLLEMKIDEDILHNLYEHSKFSEKSMKDLMHNDNFNAFVKAKNIKLLN